MFNLTNAIAMSALDCHFTLLSYIVTIIIDSSMGIVIIVGWGLWVGLYLSRFCYFLGAMGELVGIYIEVFVEDGGGNFIERIASLSFWVNQKEKLKKISLIFEEDDVF